MNSKDAKPTSSFLRFVAGESAGGVVLALAAVIALIVSNSGASAWYQQMLRTPGEVCIGADAIVLAKPLLLWVNDLWMAVFFLLVGLEIKRAFVEGELADSVLSPPARNTRGASLCRCRCPSDPKVSALSPP